MVNRIDERTVHVIIHARSHDVVGTHSELIRPERHPVESSSGVTDCLITAQAHVVNKCRDVVA
jgi:hypothetical protein